MEKVVLENKKTRIEANIEEQRTLIAVMKKSLKQLQNDLNRLNVEHSKQTIKETQLTNDNFNFETAFLERLKEMEEESVRLESKIENLKTEKADILQEIVQAERQICLWERKIQLEKEMQETIDPSIGQAEVEQMKKEIHRMELRYAQLQKKQEVLIQEMERAVSKRETIQLK